MYDNPDWKLFFRRDSPFGPAVSEKMNTFVLGQIFDSTNNLWREAQKHKNPILGRRGSGKTAFARNLANNGNFDVVVFLEPDKAFQSVLSGLSALSENLSFTEELSRIWNLLFWLCVAQELNNNGHILPFDVQYFLFSIGAEKHDTPLQAMQKALAITPTNANSTRRANSASFLELLSFDGITYFHFQSSLSNFMNENKWTGIIVLDTLEDFQLEYDRMGKAIRGLLMCSNTFNTYDNPVTLRFCLPTELLQILRKLSSNPLKDFENKMLLQWRAPELLSLACHRYRIFLGVYEPTEYQQTINYDLNLRRDAQRFWFRYFPETIRNRLGGNESSISYILRHTQLLPRHLILLLNSIASENVRLGQSPLKFSQDAVVGGVKEKEADIVDEIVTGFRYVYPELDNTLRSCIKQLPYTFYYSTLHRIYVQYGQDTVGRKNFEYFCRALVESGVVGLMNASSEQYIEARFEYTQPNALDIPDDCYLCLHPIVARVHNAKRGHEGNYEDAICVYPYGIDVSKE